jgi:hypothetical protein
MHLLVYIVINIGSNHPQPYTTIVLDMFVSTRFCLVRHNMLKQWLFKVAGVQWHSSHWYCASFSLFWCICWCIVSSISVLTTPNLKQPLFWICVCFQTFCLVRHNMLKQWLFKVVGVQWHSSHWYCASFSLFWCICWCVLSPISVLATPNLKQPLFWICVFSTRFSLPPTLNNHCFGYVCFPYVFA